MRSGAVQGGGVFEKNAAAAIQPLFLYTLKEIKTCAPTPKKKTENSLPARGAMSALPLGGMVG
jgi:hypothetical protein